MPTTSFEESPDRMSPSSHPVGHFLCEDPWDDVDTNTGGAPAGTDVHEVQDAPAHTDARSRRTRARASLEERLARPAPTVWLSGQEAAEYVGVCWPTLRQTLLNHAIPHVRVGRRWAIDVADLDEHLHRIAGAG